MIKAAVQLRTTKQEWEQVKKDAKKRKVWHLDLPEYQREAVFEEIQLKD